MQHPLSPSRPEVGVRGVLEAICVVLDSQSRSQLPQPVVSLHRRLSLALATAGNEALLCQVLTTALSDVARPARNETGRSL